MIEKIQKHSFLSILLLLMPIHVYAAPANTVVATINTGVTPAGLAITANNKFAYVANNNNYTIPDGDSVSVLNLTNNTVDQIISSTTFNQPYTITINAAGTLAYVTNSNSTTITVIDLTTNTVTNLIGGFDGPSGMVIIPPGNKAYVNNYGGPEGVGSGFGTTLSILDLNTNMIIGTIIVGMAPAAMAITPDGQFVYVINYVDGNTGTGTTSVVRTSDDTVVDTIPGFSGPFGIAITPNGKFAYVTNFGSNNFAPIGTTVSVIDLTSNMITATINLSIQPSGIAITPDGRLAYASNYNTLYMSGAPAFTGLTAGEGTVNIIDIANNTVLPPTIVVGESPDAIAISPDGNFAYVSNFTANTVSVIALQPFQIVLHGCKLQNRFLTHIDLVNKLTWSVSGTTLPVSYSIYRDAALTELVAIVPTTGPLQFFDHNRLPNVVYTYYLVGTNAVGTTSAPLAITVTQNC
jgi:YVTN family beta-propeller protein